MFLVRSERSEGRVPACRQAGWCAHKLMKNLYPVTTLIVSRGLRRHNLKEKTTVVCCCFFFFSLLYLPRFRKGIRIIPKRRKKFRSCDVGA